MALTNSGLWGMIVITEMQLVVANSCDTDSGGLRKQGDMTECVILMLTGSNRIFPGVWLRKYRLNDLTVI
jgi:hypothetical protein